jgi:hypothetical protein
MEAHDDEDSDDVVAHGFRMSPVEKPVERPVERPVE